MKKSILAVATTILATSTMMTSCDMDVENTLTRMGFFTIEKNGNSYILHQDGGGTVIPTDQSVYDISGGKGLKDVERAMFYFNYKESDISADYNTITGATLTQGSIIPVKEPIALQKAEEGNILSTDSIHQVTSVSHVWGYRGYLSFLFIAPYRMGEKTGIYPNMNLVYDPEEMLPNELNLHFYYNKRGENKQSDYGKQEFIHSFSLTGLDACIPGSDSVKLNVVVDGIKEPVHIKLGRNDFKKLVE